MWVKTPKGILGVAWDKNLHMVYYFSGPCSAGRIEDIEREAFVLMQRVLCWVFLNSNLVSRKTGLII